MIDFKNIDETEFQQCDYLFHKTNFNDFADDWENESLRFKKVLEKGIMENTGLSIVAFNPQLRFKNESVGDLKDRLFYVDFDAYRPDADFVGGRTQDLPMYIGYSKSWLCEACDNTSGEFWLCNQQPLEIFEWRRYVAEAKNSTAPIPQTEILDKILKSLRETDKTYLMVILAQNEATDQDSIEVGIENLRSCMKDFCLSNSIPENVRKLNAKTIEQLYKLEQI